MVKKVFEKGLEYIHIPVCDETPDNYNYIKVYDGDKQVNEFYIGITAPTAEKKTDFYVAMYMGRYKNEVTLVCEGDVPEDYFDGIIKGSEPEKEKSIYPELYNESTRQLIHFSSRIGWMNDPNGLFYKDGKFNLYFQHNPFSSHHCVVNISWGHAISEDGIHFKEYYDAIMPYSSRCLVASGSAVVDDENISGKGMGTVIAAYTALQAGQYKGRPGVTQNEGQMILYSIDDGMNFEYFEDNPAVSVPDTMLWRDPKIFILDGKLCMVVYETFEGENCASFYISDNCKDWKFVSRSKDLYECPDLFPLVVPETGEELWVLYGASGLYSVGTFENFVFSVIESGLYVDYGTNVYAGQTFNNYPDKTFRYHLAWMRDKGELDFVGRSFNQAMTLMCKLTLHKTKYGYRLFRNVSENIEILRTDKTETQIESGKFLSVPAEYIFYPDSDKEITFIINEQGFAYNPKNKTIVTTSNKKYTFSCDDVPEFRMFTDRRSVEFFVAGEISMSFCAEPEKDVLTIEGVDKIDAVKYNLESIWKGNN